MNSEDIELTIGSDPEFVIMCGDSVENALEIFQRVSEMEHCCECPRPSKEDIKRIYNSMWSIYIRNSLENIGTKLLHRKHPRFAATEFVNIMMEYHDNKVRKVVKKIINLLNIDDEELNDATDELRYFKDKDKNVDRRLIHIMLAVKNKIAYKNLDIYENIPETKVDIFEKSFINEIIKYYKSREYGYPNLDDLPDKIREEIEDIIINDYETDCSACEVGESYFCTTELGCDGQSALGEMRPKYGNDPIEHFNEILKLMKELNELLEPELICYGENELQVKAGSIQNDYLLGGHIHIGFKEILIHNPGKAGYISKWLPKMLSIYVGFPLTLIEEKNEAMYRHENYGYFGAFKFTDYGIEFRMPSSWLVSPLITIGALSLTYVVAYDYIEVMMSGKDTYRNKEFFDVVNMFNSLYTDFLDGNEYALKININEIKQHVQSLKLYPEYKEYIDHIFDMIDKNEIWESDKNILPRWAEMW